MLAFGFAAADDGEARQDRADHLEDDDGREHHGGDDGSEVWEAAVDGEREPDGETGLGQHAEAEQALHVALEAKPPGADLRADEFSGGAAEDVGGADDADRAEQGHVQVGSGDDEKDGVERRVGLSQSRKQATAAVREVGHGGADHEAGDQRREVQQHGQSHAEQHAPD